MASPSNGSHTNGHNSKATTTKKSRWSWFGTVVRIVLLDVPLVIILTLYASLLWTRHVHDTYLEPQMEAMEWTSDRALSEENTYYHRHCTLEDLSTFTGSDLFLSEQNTAQEAYEHQLRHGFTVIPNVLTEKTATKLRNHIIAKNYNLSSQEAISLDMQEHRWSFGLGTENVQVAEAMMEFASHPPLKHAMDAILGTNPAMLEMTAITSAYGAIDQFWHADGDPGECAGQYARTFMPAYSVFVPLQNTTREMGATSACPGTHVCASGDLEDLCQEHGFQLVNKEGYWKVGDAMIMNMDGFHRGAAHTDPNAPERVMLIMSFMPRPEPRAESRQMLSGISYSARWNMWGHTWNDLANAQVHMVQPWATLRALGLYSGGEDWGMDYVTGSLKRMANEQFGFREDDLEDFMRHGGFPFLPLWLQGDVHEEELWPEFLVDTMNKCESFLELLVSVVIGSYVLWFLVVVAIVCGGGVRRFVRAMVRLAVLVGIVVGVYRAALHHVDHSQWALDILHGRLFYSPFPEEVSRYHGPTTFPHRNDVLIESRTKSKYLALYNDIVTNHPGNRLFHELVNDKASLTYEGLPPIFRDKVAEYIVGAISNQAGRFLYQRGTDSNWMEMSDKDAVAHTKEELAIRSTSPVLRRMLTELEYLESEAKYGYLRDTAMSLKHNMAFMRKLRSALLNKAIPSEKVVKESKTDKEETIGTLLLRSFSIEKPESEAAPWRRVVELEVGEEAGEPEQDAWLREGDAVSVLTKEHDGWFWYKGVLRIAQHPNYWGVYFPIDETKDHFRRGDRVTRYVPPRVGEKVQVLDDNDAFVRGTVIGENDNGSYNVKVKGEVYEDLNDDFFRRSAR